MQCPAGVLTDKVLSRPLSKYRSPLKGVAAVR